MDYIRTWPVVAPVARALENRVWSNRDRHLPCCVALDGSDSCVCGHDDFAHDGDDGDHFGFAVVDEAFEEGAHGWVVVSCGHGGHERARLRLVRPPQTVLRPRVLPLSRG